MTCSMKHSSSEYYDQLMVKLIATVPVTMLLKTEDVIVNDRGQLTQSSWKRTLEIKVEPVEYTTPQNQLQKRLSFHGWPENTCSEIKHHFKSVGESLSEFHAISFKFIRKLRSAPINYLLILDRPLGRIQTYTWRPVSIRKEFLTRSLASIPWKCPNRTASELSTPVGTSQSLTPPESGAQLSPLEYDRLSEETLQELADFFDELGEMYELGDAYDMQLSDGVLNVNFGPKIGTYIINRQAPNKQLWLSSPKSGPKRYDYVPANGAWVYRHDKSSLHDLLSSEVSEIIGRNLDIPFTVR